MRDKKKQRDWIKCHYQNIVGLRPISKVNIQMVDGKLQTVTPKNFLYRHRGEKTFILWPTNVRIHFPRSLGRRVRITVNKTGKIVGETDKCFK